jgi:hypothetical protein
MANYLFKIKQMTTSLLSFLVLNARAIKDVWRGLTILYDKLYMRKNPLTQPSENGFYFIMTLSFSRACFTLLDIYIN